MHANIEAFHRPTSLAEAIALLSDPARKAIAVAGATEVGLRVRSSVRALVDLSALGLDFVRSEADGLHLGAMVRATRIHRDPAIRTAIGDALPEAAFAIASEPIRNLTSLGGNVTAVRCNYLPDSKSGTPGADTYKVKGNIHWVSAQHAHAAEVRLYDRLFKVPNPGAGGTDYLGDINPASRKVITARLEPLLREAKPEDRFQFERHGYFVADLRESGPGAPVFNRTVTLRDSWTKPGS